MTNSSYTIRSALALMVALAIFCALTAIAIQGANWAIAIVSGLLGIGLLFVAYAAVFLLLYTLAALLPHRPTREERLGPFATHRPPPQLVPVSKQDAE